MKRVCAAVVALCLLNACTTPARPSIDDPSTSGALYETIRALDADVFDAFNTCDRPGRLQAHERYFAEDVEFYHDNGGVTWNRRDMIANTGTYVCGHFSRRLVPGSLRVHPIKDFGAIAEGEHRFCQFATGDCDGIARFVIVWHRVGDGWTITRVLSYGHRPA